MVLNVSHAKVKPIGFEEAIAIALQKNFDILIAQGIRKGSLLSTRLAHLHIWLPKATFMAAQEHKWQKGTKSFDFRSDPFFTLTWELKSIFDKIFQTKINNQHHAVNTLIARKSISDALQKVVTCYYELALAQKKWELSSTFIRIAASRLKIEEQKFKLGFVPKINFLNADLALKEAHLALLEEEETLKEKRRNLNLMLGRPLNEAILVQSHIPIAPIWDMHAVTKDKVVDLETAIQEKKVAIAALELKQAKAYPLSCLSLSSGFCSNGYSYNLQDKRWSNNPSSKLVKIWITIDVGTLLLMPTEITKARIALHNETFKLRKEKLAAEGNLEDKQWVYHHALGLHRIAAERLKVSKQKLAFVQKAYQLNQVKLLELQEAEEVLQKSEIDTITYAFKVKQAECALYRLVGRFDK
ncbi:TolC family protein [Cardinium endosymbiont of Philonthus spinipes]|uniref:TolC family protein n=1 Tax=Cardinium endosymbiont of Philonthus spinipes TaxID=3077941 RepID=UPI00313E5325